MSAGLDERILAALERRQPRAAFVAEVAAALRPPPPPGQIEDALRDLGEQGRVVIADHAAPDVHLESSDLRIVACVPDENAESERLAREAAEELWNTWLRAFLSTHRCQ